MDSNAGADPGGGSRGSSEPPLAGESFCTTTPPVDKHQNELFFLFRPPVANCNSVHVFCFPRPRVGNRLIGVSQVKVRVDEHPALRDYLP